VPDTWVDLPFAEARNFLIAKGIVTREQFDALTAEERLKSFTVTGVNRLDVLQHVLDAVTEAVGEGTTLAEFADNLDEVLSTAGLDPVSPWRAETIFRTGVQSAYGRGRWEQMTDPDIADEVFGWRYLTVGDDRVRDEHAALEGHVFATGEGEEFFPPWDFNCFTPENEVEGRFSLGSRFLYTGKVREVFTKAGSHFRVTPNHPVATPRGFVPAHRLVEGDYLIRHTGGLPGEQSTGPVSRELYEQNPPTEVAKVFGAMDRLSGIRRAHRFADNFHGDAVTGEGEVEVVGADGELLDRIQASRPKFFGNLILERVDTSATLHHRLGALDLAPHWVSISTPRRPSTSALALDSDFVRLENGPLQALSFGATAKLNTLTSQLPRNRRTADRFFFRELLARGSGLVAPDQITRIAEMDFRGHVYDLQSETGLVVAGGAILSNCRCSSEIILNDEAAAAGLTGGGLVPPESQAALAGSSFTSPAVSYAYTPDLSGFEPALAGAFVREQQQEFGG
jgi:SPP1 gp7 family putative phage head morphogenesis protein